MPKETENQENSRERLESKLGWVKEYQESLIMWHEMISITRNIEAKIKKEGLSEN